MAAAVTFEAKAKHHRVHAMRLEIINSGEALSEDIISEWQAYHNVALPGDYVAFLLRHNGGEFPGRNGREYKCNESPPDIIPEIRHFHSLTLEYPEFNPDMELLRAKNEAWLEIAMDAVGSIYLILGREESSPIDLVAPDLGEKGYRVAESFSEFIASISGVEDPSSFESEALPRAIEIGDCSAIRELCDQGKRDEWWLLPDGRHVLALAYEYGRPAAATTLIECGAPIHSEDSSGHAPLVAAVVNGQSDSVRELLDMGADVNAKSKNDESVLMLALKYQPKRVHMHCMLLERGADVNFVNRFGESPLSSCAYMQWNLVSAVRRLVRNGADSHVAMPKLVLLAREQADVHWDAELCGYRRRLSPSGPLRVLQELDPDADLGELSG